MRTLYAALSLVLLVSVVAISAGCGGAGAPAALGPEEEPAAGPGTLTEDGNLVTPTANGTQLVITMEYADDDWTAVLDNLGKWNLIPTTGTATDYPYPTNPPLNDNIVFAGDHSLVGGHFTSNSVTPVQGDYGLVCRFRLPKALFAPGVHVDQAFLKVKSLTTIATDDGCRLDPLGARDGLGNLQPWGTDTPELTSSGWPKGGSIHGPPIPYVNGSARYCLVPWTIDNLLPLVRHRLGPWVSGKHYQLFRTSSVNARLTDLINAYIEDVANPAQAQARGSHLAFWVRVYPTKTGAFREVSDMTDGRWDAPRLVLHYTVAP